MVSRGGGGGDRTRDVGLVEGDVGNGGGLCDGFVGERERRGK